MSIRDLLFKSVMNRASRVRGFTKKCYFAHPFLDAFFVWFPLGDMKYGGAEIGEIYEVAARINERDPMSWGKDAILHVHEFDKLLASTNKTKRITAEEGAEAQLSAQKLRHPASNQL